MKLECKRCGNGLGKWDERTLTPIELLCRDCGSFFVFYPRKRIYREKLRPKRRTASGLRIF